MTQDEYKQMIVALYVIVELSDASKHPDLSTYLNEALKTSQRVNGFKLKVDLLADKAIAVDNIGSKLMDSYTEKRWEYVERANQELHQYAQDNFHPDIYNLPEGEILQVAEL